MRSSPFTRRDDISRSARSHFACLSYRPTDAIAHLGGGTESSRHSLPRAGHRPKRTPGKPCDPLISHPILSGPTRVRRFPGLSARQQDAAAVPIDRRAEHTMESSILRCDGLTSTRWRFVSHLAPSDSRNPTNFTTVALFEGSVVDGETEKPGCGRCRTCLSQSTSGRPVRCDRSLSYALQPKARGTGKLPGCAMLLLLKFGTGHSSCNTKPSSS
jgi:hypothetical protein